MATKTDICAKCGGALLFSYGVKTCINCGAEPMTNLERQAWWSEHKKEIAGDISKIGAPATIKKWWIPRQLLSQFSPRKARISSKTPAQAPYHPPAAELPKFPEFKDSWMASVQEKWLNIWLYLVTNQQGEEVSNAKDDKAQ